MTRRDSRPKARHWAEVAAEQFAPTHFELDEEMRNDIAAGLYLGNLIRTAQGLPSQTLDEALAGRLADIASGAYAVFVTTEVPRLIAEARARSAATRNDLYSRDEPSSDGRSHGL